MPSGRRARLVLRKLNGSRRKSSPSSPQDIEDVELHLLVVLTRVQRVGDSPGTRAHERDWGRSTPG
jgi:hypothetical protein